MHCHMKDYQGNLLTLVTSDDIASYANVDRECVRRRSRALMWSPSLNFIYCTPHNTVYVIQCTDTEQLQAHPMILLASV